MPRVRPKKPKHIPEPSICDDGRGLVLRDRSRLGHYTDYTKPKIGELKTDDVIAFNDKSQYGHDVILFGRVVSTNPTEVFVKVTERHGKRKKSDMSQPVVWHDVEVDYVVTAGQILGYKVDYDARVHVYDKLVGGKVYGLGYRLDGVGRPTGALTDPSDPHVAMV